MNYSKFQPKDFDLKAYGAFFAFNQKQFNEQSKEGIEYVNCGGGLIAPADIVEEMLDSAEAHYSKENLRILNENGLDNCILYELWNHECFYTYNLSEVTDICKDRWNTSAEDVKRVFNANKHKYKE